MFLAIALVAGVLGRAHPQGADGGAAPPIAAITSAELEADVRFLASDRLRGRETGTPEEKLAAEYIAGRLERAGLRPGGDDGGFLQEVRLERTHYEGLPDLELLLADGTTSEAEYRFDFDVALDAASTERLRVLPVFTMHAEPRAPDPSAAVVLVGSTSENRDWLERSGSPEGEGWGLVVRAGSQRPGGERDAPLPRSRLRRPAERGGAVPWMRAHKPLFDLLKGGQVRELQLSTRVRREPVAAFNVVAVLPGRGAEDEADGDVEAVVVSAHYDHLGARETGERRETGEKEGAQGGAGAGTDGAGGAGGAQRADGVDGADGANGSAEETDGDAEDPIYNGADDNASGTAAVLELAEAFAAGPQPSRTLVFLLATGEEKGLLGTDAYLDRPAVPLERTVYNLNFEMIGRPDPLAGGPGRMWMVGWDLTDVGPALAEAGLAIVPDPRPDERFFMRSDNVAFVRRGIVGQSLSSFGLHADYHRPSDEAETLDYDHMEACTREAYRALRRIADGELRPRWTGEPPLKAR